MNVPLSAFTVTVSGSARTTAREQGYIYGTANLHRDSTLSVRVRARFDPGGWSTWSEPVNLHCFETENPATSQHAPPENSPSTSAPTVTGTAQVGETLTAGTSSIADEDGLNNASFAYQWLADDSEIAGATGSTYTLTDDDEDKSVKVRVTFTDDAGNEESLTSVETDQVEAPPGHLCGFLRFRRTAIPSVRNLVVCNAPAQFSHSS